jgi:hypothetical protein
MAADVGSDRHLGVEAGCVEALQACVESLFTHLKSAGAEATLAPLYPSASMSGVAMMPEESVESRRAQAEASLSLSLPKRALRCRPSRMRLPALGRMDQESKAKKDGSDIRVGGGCGEEGSREKGQTDQAKANLQVDVVVAGGMYYYEEDLQARNVGFKRRDEADVELKGLRTGASRFQTPKFSRALSRPAKPARFFEDEDGPSALTLEGATHQFTGPVTPVLAPTPEGMLRPPNTKPRPTVLKQRGSKQQRGSNALQSAGKGQVQEEDETQGWMPYYLTPRTKQAFVVHRRRMKKVLCHPCGCWSLHQRERARERESKRARERGSERVREALNGERLIHGFIKVCTCTKASSFISSHQSYVQLKMRCSPE